MLNTFKKSVAAGGMIGVGSTVYLVCENKVVGALLFSIGLFVICSFGLYLFTGKIGYVLSNKNDPNCAMIWLGNLVGSIAVSLAVRLAKPALQPVAAEMVANKLNQSLLSVILLSFLCGVLMYLAVDNFAKHPHSTSGIVGVVLCVSVFILCGFEHSIADMNYCVVAVGSLYEGVRSLVFLLLVSVFNGIGALAVRQLVKD